MSGELPTWLQVLQALGPTATVTAALIAAVIALATLKHRRRQDRREQWWARAQWAIDRAASDNPRAQTAGLAVLSRLSASNLADPEDVETLLAIPLQELSAFQGEWGRRKPGTDDEGPVE